MSAPLWVNAPPVVTERVFDTVEVAHKIDVLRRHCESIGRDPNEIEVTAMFRDLPAAPSAGDVMRKAEEFAKIGVSTLVTGAVGDDPAGWLESTFGPAQSQTATRSSTTGFTGLARTHTLPRSDSPRQTSLVSASTSSAMS